MGGTGEESPRESELKKQKLEPQDEEFIVDVAEGVTDKATKSSDDVEEVERSMEAVGGEDPKVEEEEDDDDDLDDDDDDDKIVTVIQNYEGENKCVYGSIDSDVDEEEEDDHDKGEEEEDDDDDDDDDEAAARYRKQVFYSDGFYLDHVPKCSANLFPRFVPLTLHDDISLDKKLEKLASIAVEVYNNQKAANLKFEKLLFATCRPCGDGHIFYITFSANNSANHKAATYQSIVYRGFHFGRRRDVEVQLFRRKPKWYLPIV